MTVPVENLVAERDTLNRKIAEAELVTVKAVAETLADAKLETLLVRLQGQHDALPGGTTKGQLANILSGIRMSRDIVEREIGRLATAAAL